MGVALFIVAERKVPNLETDVNGKGLGRCEGLDKLAESAGVRPLMEFFSEDPDEALAAWEEMGDMDAGYFRILNLDGFSRALREWIAFVRWKPSGTTTPNLSLSIE